MSLCLLEFWVPQHEVSSTFTLVWGLGHVFEGKQDQEILQRAGQGVGLRTLAALWTHPMLSAFVLCCNFCACKCACTVGVWSPTGGVGVTFDWHFRRMLRVLEFQVVPAPL